MACSQPRLLHRHWWRDARPGAAQGQTRPAGRRLQEVRWVHRGAEDRQVAAAAGLHGGGDAGGAYRESCKLRAGAKAPFEILIRVGSNEGVGQNSIEVIKIPERQHDALASQFSSSVGMCTQRKVCKCRRRRNDKWVLNRICQIEKCNQTKQHQSRVRFSGWPWSGIGFPLRLLMWSGRRLPAENRLNDRMFCRRCSAALINVLLMNSIVHMWNLHERRQTLKVMTITDQLLSQLATVASLFLLFI